MKINVYMSKRDKSAYAEGVYDVESTVVKAGGRISETFHGTSKIEAIRNDYRYVDRNRNIIKDCVFNTPSEAAQFVNGNISNGFRVWKVNGINLGVYLSAQEKK